MTNQEAKEVEKLKYAISSIRTNMSYPNGRLCSAGEIAVEAIEKQIPKKPICIEDKMWCCPKCDNNLMNKWVKYPTKLVPKSAGLPYCLSCGQRIDWSEV